MPKKSTVVRIALLFSLTLVYSANFVVGHNLAALPLPVQAQLDCSTVTDEQIRQEIVQKLIEYRDFNTKAKRDRLLHFNLTVKNKVVKLDGYVEGAPTYTLVLRLVKSIKSRPCLNGIDVLRFDSKPGGSCDPLTEKPCRGVCIAKTDDCLEIE